MEKNFKFMGCDHVGLVVKDIQRSKDFYCNVMDMEVIYEADVPTPSGLITTCFVKKDNLVIDIEQFPEWDPTLKDGFVGHIAFLVDDFEAAEAYLKSKGVKFDNEESVYNADVYGKGVRFNFFRGPDGEMMELFKVYG